MTNNDDFDKILKSLGKDDCPAELIDLLEASQSKWRKGLVKEFILDHIWKKNVENKLKRLSRENKGIMLLLVGLIAVALKIAIFGAA